MQDAVHTVSLRTSWFLSTALHQTPGSQIAEHGKDKMGMFLLFLPFILESFKRHLKASIP